MGNLHAGHVSLIEAARRHGERFVASIFVNPMQFGPNEDFAHYPRTPREDERMLAAAGCDLMFMPDVPEIYPHGAERATRVEVPGLSRILEGEFRPGHFEGVSTVVAKLFHIVEPDVAVFGEKDFQQLTVIRRMVADLCMPVEIVGAPTVRDADGLAMSSRNQYLTAAERALAPRIYATLQRGGAAPAAGRCGFRQHRAQRLRARSSARAFGPITSRCAMPRTSAPPTHAASELVVLTAARLGKARLIDNVQVTRPSPNGARARTVGYAAAVPLQRPLDVLAHQRRGDRRGAPRAPAVPRPTSARCRARPRCCATSARSRCDRSPSRACAPRTAPPSSRNSAAQARRIEPVAHLEVRMRRRAGELVPRAHQLAVIAAVDAVAERRRAAPRGWRPGARW